jgi:hypothetical protein
MKSRIPFRQIALICFGVLVASAVANYDKLLPHRWQTYTAPDKSFTVELPGKPSIETIQAPIEGGGTKPMTLVSVKPTNSTVYTCSYADDEYMGNKSPDEVLDTARDGSLSKTQGTVISQKRVTVQGYPALEMQARVRGHSLLDARIVVVGKRLYLIVAVATIEQDRDTSAIQRMFETFKVIHR